MAFLSVACAVVALGFAAEAMGLFSHELNVALALLFLVLSAVLAPIERAATGLPSRARRAAGAILAIAGIALLPTAWNVRFFGIALWFAGLDIATDAGGGRTRSALPLGIACVLYGLFEWCAGSSLVLWNGVQAWSFRISGLAGELCGKPLALGPTFSGVGMVVLALAAIAVTLAVCPLSAKAIRRAAVAATAVLALHYFYLCTCALGPAVPSIADRLYPLHLPMLLTLGLAALLGVYVRGCSPRDAVRDFAGASLRIVTLAVAAACAVGLLTNLPPAAPPPPRTVALYKEGFVNWLSPTHERYGRYSTGMFGNLPKLVGCMGWQSVQVPTIDRESLAGKDVLVIINQDKPLPRESLAAIDAFVEQGGGLLVMGDHTFWKTERRILPNEPLERSHIRLRFDSADFFIGGWLHSYRYWPHAITAGLHDQMNEAGTVVGASLAIGGPAVPLVVGRYGYSDPGVETAADHGYLGNLDYDPGEPLGDVVLVAAENVGRGRMVVAGDTSGFTNGIMDHTWPFVQRVFWWLGNDGRAALPWWREAPGLALAALVAFLVLLFGGTRPAVIAGAALACFTAAWLSGAALRTVGVPPPLTGKVAIVDESHGGMYSPEGWHNDAVDGVYLHLMRDGYFPAALSRFDSDAIEAGELFVTIAPTTRYRASEVRTLRKFMERGGTVLLAVGWEDRAAALPLLEMAELEIAPRPLGRTTGSGAPLAEEPMIYEAWPVLGGEPLLTARGEPVVARKAIGKGRIIVIGDSRFLTNKNLEVKDGGILRNVHFLTWLLAQPSGR